MDSLRILAAEPAPACTGGQLPSFCLALAPGRDWTYGEDFNVEAARFWANVPAGRLVGDAGHHLCRPDRLHRLLHLGRAAKRPLPDRALPLALLFARDIRLERSILRSEAGLVAGVAALLTGADYPSVSRALPI